jgi:hypothetical protein
MADDQFAELEQAYSCGGADAVLARLADEFRRRGDYHALFDARLMQARRRLGMPIILGAPLDELAEPIRTEVENAYLEACRESGWLLWKDCKYREAWLYLRPLGENGAVATALERAAPNEDVLPALIEIALHEGAAPALGYKLVLDHYGTCNAITAFDTEMQRHNRRQQQLAAGHLVRRLHEELKANVLADIARLDPEGGDAAAKKRESQSLPELLAGRDDLFGENNYHIDTSHLAATVRIARIVEDPAVLQLAWELTEYGRRLNKTFQFVGDEPFEDVYPAHGLFFAAQLGRQVEESLAYFRERGEKADIDAVGTAAPEAYIVLLVRLGRFTEALDAHIRLLPAGVGTSSFAPTLLELGRLSGDYSRLTAVCRERGDLLGFAAGMLAK